MKYEAREAAIVFGIILAICVMLLSGCAHCSKTVTKFDGKTTGINPYGSGKVKVVREAYWGFKQCILRLINRDTKTENLPKNFGVTNIRPEDNE